jgi:hypothetical protein
LIKHRISNNASGVDHLDGFQVKIVYANVRN